MSADLVLGEKPEQQAQIIAVVADSAGAVVADLQVVLELVQKFIKFHSNGLVQPRGWDWLWVALISAMLVRV